MAAIAPIANPPLAARVPRDTVSILTPGQIPKQDYSFESKRIYVKNAEAAPLTLFSQALADVEGWGNTEYWYEDEHVPQMDVTDGSVAAGAATMTVGNGAKWTKNDTLWLPIPLNLEAIVTNVVGNVLTLTWMTAAPAALASGQVIIRIGNAYQEYSMHEDGPTTREVQKSNYFQDMRHGRAFSDIEAEAQYRTPQKDRDFQIDKAGQQHEIEWEKRLIWGQAALDVTGAHPRGFCRGMWNYATTNSVNVGGVALTQAGFDNFLSGPLDMNHEAEQDWWFLHSPTIGRYISGWAAPLERTDTTKSRFGMAISQYKAPTGQVITCKVHPLFHEHRQDGIGLLINRSRKCMAYVHNTKFATKRYQSIMPYGLSGYDDFFRTVATLVFKHESINAARMFGVV